VREEGEYLLARKELLREGKNAILSDAKTVQVNSTDLYVIGGSEKDHSLLTKPYHVPTSCLKINIETGQLLQQNSMTHDRISFGLCHITHHIFVIGGLMSGKCEKYDIFTGNWTELDCDLHVAFITAVPVR